MRNLLTLIYVVLAPIGVATAQELTLFEQIEADPEADQPAQPSMGGMQQNGQPAFTLRGTSRFGDEYTTTLLNRNGEPIKVKWREGENVSVPGFDGFNVVAISSKSVTLAHPAFDACIPSDETGVSCTGTNVAVLSMATSTPLPSNGPPPNSGQGQNQQFGATNGEPVPAIMHNAEGQQVFINPFSGEAELVTQPSPEEQAARADRQRARAERLNQFEAVRIDPADVPPGMRLVRTPFGDRVVPER